MELKALTDEMANYVYESGTVNTQKLNTMFFQFLGKLPNNYPVESIVESAQKAADAWGDDQTADPDVIEKNIDGLKFVKANTYDMHGAGECSCCAKDAAELTEVYAVDEHDGDGLISVLVCNACFGYINSNYLTSKHAVTERR